MKAAIEKMVSEGNDDQDMEEDDDDSGKKDGEKKRKGSKGKGKRRLEPLGFKFPWYAYRE